MSESNKKLGNVIEIDQARIENHLGELVRGTVESTLNALLEAEADRICGAWCYERTDERRDMSCTFAPGTNLGRALSRTLAEHLEGIRFS